MAEGEYLIIADDDDDDVRYAPQQLDRVGALLGDADVVRPSPATLPSALPHPCPGTPRGTPAGSC